MPRPRRTFVAVSLGVELADLQQKVSEFGPVAFLVTTGDGARPHVVSVRVQLVERRLVAGVGRTTAANVAARPDVTVLWPAAEGEDYCLIVDGRAGATASTLEIEPVRAVLHRVADAVGGGESCIPVVDRRSD